MSKERTLSPSERVEIIERRGNISDGDGKKHRTSNLEIHHKDRDPSNNELKNLRVLTKEEHQKLHQRAGR
jgi:hypothetical protein